MIRMIVVRVFVALLMVLTVTVAFSQQPGLTMRRDGTGVVSIGYHGQELLATAPASLSITVAETDGKSTTLQGNADARRTLDGDTIIHTFDGAVLLTNITQDGDTVKLKVTLRNTGQKPFTRMRYKPFIFQFPKRSLGTSWKWGYAVTTSNEGEPGVVEANWGDSKVLACVDEIERPVTFGFDGNYGNSTTNALTIEMPLMLQPGKETQYRFSLRFAPGNADTLALTRDLNEQFARRYPYTLTWEDRRPIGAIFLCLSATKWATNPRGWFGDSKVDITTEAGRAAFRARLMQYADQCIKEMSGVGAQGMILWDVEGDEMPHAITYIGDPRVLPQCAPEMDACADAFFKKFIDAGLKVGVCIRPSRVIPNGQGGWKHLQVDDHVAEMAEKIAYCKRRWGCTIFYMDTNVKWERGMWQGNASVLPAADLARLCALHPDVLIFPEFGRMGYWSVCMPYGELRAGTTRTKDSIKAIYPKAGSTITVADGDFFGNWNSLRQGALHGDIQLFRGWFSDPENRQVANVYRETSYLKRGATVKLHDTLAQQLTDADPVVRYTALSTITHPTHEQVAVVLERLLLEQDWVVKKQIVELLGASGQADAVPALASLLQDRKAGLDAFAGNALARIGPAATKSLLAMADSKDVWLTEKALDALSQYVDATALPAVLALSAHENLKIRLAAIRALGAQHDPSATARLVALLKDDQVNLLIEVCRALGRSRDRTAIPALVETIERSVRTLKNNTLRLAAGDALEAITGKEFGPYDNRWRSALTAGTL